MTQDVVTQLAQYAAILHTTPWDYQIAAKDLPVQVGSLTKLLMQLHGERYAHGLRPEELKEKIADELADILSMILYIAHALHIDMQEAWQGMLNSDATKFQARGDKLKNA